MGSRSDAAGHAPLSGHFPENASPTVHPAAVDAVLLLTPRTGGQQNHLQQRKHQEKLHPGSTFRDKPQSVPPERTYHSFMTQRFPHKSAGLLICSRK